MRNPCGLNIAVDVQLTVTLSHPHYSMAARGQTRCNALKKGPALATATSVRQEPRDKQLRCELALSLVSKNECSEVGLFALNHPIDHARFHFNPQFDSCETEPELIISRCHQVTFVLVLFRMCCVLPNN